MSYRPSVDNPTRIPFCDAQLTCRGGYSGVGG